MTHTTLLNRTETKTPGLSRNDFAKLYELYFPLVHRICYRYTKNRETAEDLAQEVFLKVHGNFSSFAGNCQPSTWLYRVATNHCLDHLRWAKRQSELISDFSDNKNFQQPPEILPDNRVRRLMSRIMENLDEANRQVVFLRFEVGLTHGEIAEICGVSRVAITKRLAKFLTTVSSLKSELTGSFATVLCRAGVPSAPCEDSSEGD
jgi:RNA polymerase sigma-70 factor (ECF subfamily)